VIFSDGAEQRRLALDSRRAAARELGREESDLQVQIRDRMRFWPAEDYHQNYARRNPRRYAYYRWACGRDRRLDQVWGAQARSGRPWTGAVGSAGSRG
jgi:peptide-methionine (S)-S-oxide reductase